MILVVREGMILIDCDHDHRIGHWKTINKYENMMQNAPDRYTFDTKIHLNSSRVTGSVCVRPRPQSQLLLMDEGKLFVCLQLTELQLAQCVRQRALSEI